MQPCWPRFSRYCGQVAVGQAPCRIQSWQSTLSAKTNLQQRAGPEASFLRATTQGATPSHDDRGCLSTHGKVKPLPHIYPARFHNKLCSSSYAVRGISMNPAAARAARRRLPGSRVPGCSSTAAMSVSRRLVKVPPDNASPCIAIIS